MNFKLEQEFSKTDIIKQVDESKHQIDAMRPLPPDVEGRVMQKLRLDWNYHSNAIEGNRLSYGETIAFLMEGITAKGKPLKDHLDIRGHNEAINFLLSIVKDTRPVTEADIRALHKMTLVEEYDVKASTADGLPTTKRITLGEYKTSPNHVKTATGEIHYYATPEETPAKMQELMEWYSKATEQPDVHPLVIAALFHHKFVSIHPFDDGNGRMSRILMNLILMQNGYPAVVVKMDDRMNYYALLNRADNGDSWPFVEYIGGNMILSLNLYLKAAQGDDINEEDDIEKQFALFKLEIQDNLKLITENKHSKSVKGIVLNVIDPLAQMVIKNTERFIEFFFYYGVFFTIVFYEDTLLDTLNLNELNHEFLNKSESDLNHADRLILKIYFSSFKNPQADFDVHYNLSVVFEEYHYKLVNNDNTLIISKLYNEVISKAEERLVVKVVMNTIQKMITDGISKKTRNYKVPGFENLDS